MAACVVALILSLTGTGCWGKREIEERSFIHVMGIDKGLKERLRVTVVISVPRMLASGGVGGGSEAMGITLSSEGWDVTDALNRIEPMSSRELTSMHIACLLLGEGFAKEDLAPLMDVFSRSLEFRPNTLVAVCRGDAGDFIRRVNAPEESELSDYLSKLITTTSESLGFCPLVTMHEFSVHYQTSEVSPWAPYLDVAAPMPVGEAEGGKAEGGDVAPRSADPVVMPAVVVGTALFALNGDKYQMVGYLDAEESRAALLLAGFSGNWYVDVQSPGDLEVTTLLMRHSSVRTSVRRQGDSVTARFVIRVSGSVEEFVVNPSAPPTTNELRIAATQTVQQRIEQLCRTTFDKMMRLRCDAIALGRSTHGTFLTYPDWEEFDWPSRLPEVTATFDVKVSIYSTGFSFQRAYPR